jgi:hypothetical protein
MLALHSIEVDNFYFHVSVFRVVSSNPVCGDSDRRPLVDLFFQCAKLLDVTQFLCAFSICKLFQESFVSQFRGEQLGFAMSTDLQVRWDGTRTS